MLHVLLALPAHTASKAMQSVVRVPEVLTPPVAPEVVQIVNKGHMLLRPIAQVVARVQPVISLPDRAMLIVQHVVKENIAVAVRRLPLLVIAVVSVPIALQRAAADVNPVHKGHMPLQLVWLDATIVPLERISLPLVVISA